MRRTSVAAVDEKVADWKKPSDKYSGFKYDFANSVSVGEVPDRLSLLPLLLFRRLVQQLLPKRGLSLSKKKKREREGEGEKENDSG